MDRLTESGAHYDDQYAVALQEIEDKIKRGEMVEVVRCKDCAKYQTRDCAMWWESDDHREQYSWNNLEDFCSHAERNEAAHE